MKKLILMMALVVGLSGIAQADSGKALYNQVCSVCHSTGLAGAPKVGSAADWKPRLAQGFDSLLHTAINGKGAMPPKGGSNADTATIKAAIKYMLKQSGVES